MRILVTGRHIDVTGPMKVYAEDKLGHLVGKHLPARIAKAHIIMDVQKHLHTVEMELTGPQINICGKMTSRNMYTSIDKVLDKIERQLIKMKTKYDKRKHKQASSIRVPEEEI